MADHSLGSVKESTPKGSTGNTGSKNKSVGGGRVTGSKNKGSGGSRITGMTHTA